MADLDETVQHLRLIANADLADDDRRRMTRESADLYLAQFRGRPGIHEERQRLAHAFSAAGPEGDAVRRMMEWIGE